MSATLVHRGPDSFGEYVDGPVAIAARRLSIIDLETGDQPIGNEDGSIQVVQNGEIYNYRELRRDLVRRGHRFTTASDTEVIVHLYEEYGDECVEHLLGQLRDGWKTWPGWGLASIGTEAAMSALADWVRAGGERGDLEDLGVWIPPTGPAQYRFPLERKAVFLRKFDDPAELSTVDNPVGLPLAEVLRDPEKSPVTWHYVSLRVDQLPGMATWPVPRVHLVGPRANWGWELTAAFDEDGRYQGEIARIDIRGEAHIERAVAERIGE